MLFLQMACVEFEEPVNDDKPKWEIFNTQNGLSSDTILSIEEGYTDEIWIGTSSGLYKYEDGSLKLWKEGLIVYSILRSRLDEYDADVMLLATNKGSLFIYNDKIYSTDEYREEVIDLVYFNNWFCSIRPNKKGFFINGNFNLFEDSNVTDLYVDNDMLIVCTDAVVWSINNNLKVNFIAVNENENSFWMRSFIDNSNSIWAGLYESKGVCKIQNDEIQYYNIGFINCFDQNKAGNIWMGSYGEGLYKLETSGNQINFTMQDGLPSNYINDLLVTDDGTLWVATKTGGVAKLNSETK